MAFNNRRSWRMKFIDIDSSFVITSVASPINGYMVCRAPKGNVRATYFSAGNGPAIDALMGVGNANWPDLLEAKAFNEEYPLYISAPPGSSAAYPSYMGGFYVTKDGLYKFYNVSDKLELQDNTGNAFKVKVQPGKENLFNNKFSSRLSKIIIAAPELEDYVPQAGEPGFGVFEFKNDTNYFVQIQKNSRLNVTEIDYDVMKNGIVSPTGTVKTYWGDDESKYWRFTGNTATMTDFGFTYDPANRGNPLFDFIGQENFVALGGDKDDPTKKLDKDAFAKLIIDGWVTLSDVTYAIPFGLQNIVSFLVSIKDDVYCYFMQKSCTEKVTQIKISNIGYDKYRYDALFQYVPASMSAWNADKKLEIDYSGLAADVIDRIKNVFLKDERYLAFYNPSKPGVILGLGEVIEPVNAGADYTFSNITSNYVTKYFTCQEALTGVQNDEIFHKIFYVAAEDNIKHVLTEEENIAQFGTIDGPNAYIKGMADQSSAPKNTTFNSLIVSCSEEVYVGKTTSGGEFLGSLDENGRDTYGAKIYFPEILQDDDVSFIEVRVLKKFGDDAEDLDSQGFWTHKRVIDPFDIDRDTNRPIDKVFTIEGDRYAHLVMTMNMMEQKTGGVWRDEWKSIIEDGLIEGTLPEYDDVYIYMELSGQEIFKDKLKALNKANEFAAVISPKILTPNNRGILTDQLAQKVIVNGRCSTTSNAQYVGEFEVYDPITFKKYWCQPMGDVGCNLARIMDKKLGGWAPAWYNIAGDLGGQLKRSVLRSKYQYEDEATHTLDTKGVNPIVFTSDDGLMIVSQKTTQDPNNLSDWSFLGHSMSFQILKREIRDNVMRPQIMKPINEYWMGLRQTQIEGILAKRTGGSSPIWAIALCDIAGQNTPQTKAQRNFVIKVDVKVNVFSETVTLILENHAQDWNG